MSVDWRRLFTYVNEARFTGTYARLIALLDNYIPDIGTPDSCGTTCRNEEEAFLDAIIATQPIQLLQSFLVSKGSLYVSFNWGITREYIDQ
jgi:Endoribonuclease XendoU